MAAMVMKDAPATKNVTNRWIVRREGHKNWLFLSLNCNAIIVPYIGCKNNPTARSETARLRISLLKDAGSDETFSMARITRTFPTIAIGEKAK